MTVYLWFDDLHIAPTDRAIAAERMLIRKIQSTSLILFLLGAVLLRRIQCRAL